MPAQSLNDKLSSAMPFVPSSQALIKDLDLAACYPPSVEPSPPLKKRHASGVSAKSSPNHISRRQWVTVLVLFFVNLINYMDRLTIAGKRKSTQLSKWPRDR